MKKFLLLTVVMFLAVSSYSAETVKVGGYLFPPFVEKKVDGNIEGLTLDMIEGINGLQSKYNFEYVMTSAKRRYEDMFSGKYDVMFFESILWGWSEQPVKASNVFLKGGEVYITNAEGGKDQSYFDTLKGKSLLGILGFHYGFANFNADENFLESNYNARMTKTHSGNILSIVNKRSDIAVVTKSYILKYLYENPGISNRLLVSEKFDQEYNHTVLVKDGANITVEEINKLLDDLKSSGKMDNILKKYGM